MEPQEHHIRVPRTARYSTLGDPVQAEEVWFVLHGYRQLAGRFIRRFVELPGLTDGRRAVVAPEGLSRFYVEEEPGPHGPGSRVGASWMTRTDREQEIRDYVEYLDLLADQVLGTAVEETSRGGGRAPRLVVLGFSQGSETASRWCVYGGVRPRSLVLWGGGLAADLNARLAEEALRDVAVTLVTGSQDRWGAEKAEDSAKRLAELGVETREIGFDGGHRVEPAVLARCWPLGE